eukprot:12594798-Alexandrium_andersonii.AAC.1
MVTGLAGRARRYDGKPAGSRLEALEAPRCGGSPRGGPCGLRRYVSAAAAGGGRGRLRRRR